MKPNLRDYKELLKAVDIKIKKEYEKELWKVAKIRDDIVHRGEFPKDEDIIESFDTISKIFTSFSEYYLSDIDRGIVQRKPIEEV